MSRSPSRTIFYLLMIFLVLALPACSAGAPDRQVSSESAPMPPAAQAPAAEMGGSGSGAVGGAGAADVPRLVIKNATLDLIVDDPAAAMDTIGGMAEGMGGFIVTANLQQTQNDNGKKIPYATITVRVPSDQLDDALSQIRSLSNQPPQNERVESQDVTAEYTDQQSRLRNLEATDVKLNSIMEEATTTEDVLSVYNRLVEVREQIEVTKGQIQYYENSARLSSIQVYLTATASVQPLTVGGWQPVGVARDALQALINTTKFLGEAAIWIIIYFLPVALILYLIFFLPLRYLWRLLRGRRPRKSPPEPPSSIPPAPTEPAP